MTIKTTQYWNILINTKIKYFLFLWINFVYSLVIMYILLFIYSILSLEREKGEIWKLWNAIDLFYTCYAIYHYLFLIFIYWRLSLFITQNMFNIFTNFLFIVILYMHVVIIVLLTLNILFLANFSMDNLVVHNFCLSYILCLNICLWDIIFCCILT